MYEWCVHWKNRFLISQMQLKQSKISKIKELLNNTMNFMMPWFAEQMAKTKIE